MILADLVVMGRDYDAEALGLVLAKHLSRFLGRVLGPVSEH